MSEVEAFLKRSKGLIGDSEEVDPETLKKMVDALRKVSPDLADSVLISWFSRLIDGLQIAVDTQAQMERLIARFDSLEKKVDRSIRQSQEAKASSDRLHGDILRKNESERQMRQKKMSVLEGLDQYLRRHS